MVTEPGNPAVFNDHDRHVIAVGTEILSSMLSRSTRG